MIYRKVWSAERRGNERMAQVRGLLALASLSGEGNKHVEFVNRDLKAAINIRRCTVLEWRPPELTRSISVGQTFKVELYDNVLKSVVGGRSKTTETRLYVSRRRFV
jgi:hypothetical protein